MTDKTPEDEKKRPLKSWTKPKNVKRRGRRLSNENAARKASDRLDPKKDV